MLLEKDKKKKMLGRDSVASEIKKKKKKYSIQQTKQNQNQLHSHIMTLFPQFLEEMSIYIYIYISFWGRQSSVFQ